MQNITKLLFEVGKTYSTCGKKYTVIKRSDSFISFRDDNGNILRRKTASYACIDSLKRIYGEIVYIGKNQYRPHCTQLRADQFAQEETLQENNAPAQTPEQVTQQEGYITIIPADEAIILREAEHSPAMDISPEDRIAEPYFPPEPSTTIWAADAGAFTLDYKIGRKSHTLNYTVRIVPPEWQEGSYERFYTGNFLLMLYNNNSESTRPMAAYSPILDAFQISRLYEDSLSQFSAQQALRKQILPLLPHMLKGSGLLDENGQIHYDGYEAFRCLFSKSVLLDRSISAANFSMPDNPFTTDNDRDNPLSWPESPFRQKALLVFLKIINHKIDARNHYNRPKSQSNAINKFIQSLFDELHSLFEAQKAYIQPIEKSQEISAPEYLDSPCDFDEQYSDYGGDNSQPELDIPDYISTFHPLHFAPKTPKYPDHSYHDDSQQNAGEQFANAYWLGMCFIRNIHSVPYPAYMDAVSICSKQIPSLRGMACALGIDDYFSPDRDSLIDFILHNAEQRRQSLKNNTTTEDNSQPKLNIPAEHEQPHKVFVPEIVHDSHALVTVASLLDAFKIWLAKLLYTVSFILHHCPDIRQSILLAYEQKRHEPWKHHHCNAAGCDGRAHCTHDQFIRAILIARAVKDFNRKNLFSRRISEWLRDSHSLQKLKELADFFGLRVKFPTRLNLGNDAWRDKCVLAAAIADFIGDILHVYVCTYEVNNPPALPVELQTTTHVSTQDDCLSIKLPIQRKKPRKRIPFEVGKTYSASRDSSYCGLQSRHFTVLDRFKKTYYSGHVATVLRVKIWGDDYPERFGEISIYDNKDSDAFIVEEFDPGVIPHFIFRADNPNATSTVSSQQQEHSQHNQQTSLPHSTKHTPAKIDDTHDHSFIECKDLHGIEALDAMRHNRLLVKSFFFPEPLTAALLTLSKQTLISLAGDFGCGYLVKKKKKPELVATFVKELFRRKEREQKPSAPTPQPQMPAHVKSTTKHEPRIDRKRQLYFSFEFDEDEIIQEKKIA
ncbi:MAG: hypothetical protein II877_01055 [Synergistaceae bacterium]|nr:hypothetical protein [Synergistaceae bacterium]